MGKYTNLLLLITTSKEVGNMLALLFAAEQNDSTVFDKAKEWCNDGTNTATHYSISVLVQAGLVQVVEEYNSAGPYPQLMSKGLTVEQITSLKSKVQIFVLNKRATQLQSILTELNLVQVESE